MRVALGVGGGIAVYKAAEVARLLAQRGVQVRVIMTASAQEFVRPLTFAALTGQKVITGLFPEGGAEGTLSSAVEHIGVALENDLLLVAPATADLMAKFAHGLADDFLSTMYLAFPGPTVLAPAMNTGMWQHPATQANLAALRERGVTIVDPESGYLACGMVGPGRLAEPESIVETVIRKLSVRRDLEGETVLITAGPTQEPIDPVRYISNRSSGKMGYALAEAAVARGAKVVLVSGPVTLTPPVEAVFVPVRTAAEMRDAVFQHLAEATIIIKAAAVADFQVARVAEQKIKKTAARVSLELDPTPDILLELGRRKEDRLLIGFAAETQNLKSEARRKLEAKGADMIVGNLVGEGAGFESDENEVVLVMRTGEVREVPRASKRKVADAILDEALTLRLALYASR
jgi:phosphopantothenoylcysteine decarboxylase/phosphopantothenate--cysteine ligase